MKEEYSVLSPKFGGGPKGLGKLFILISRVIDVTNSRQVTFITGAEYRRLLGDPNDKSLRKVEKDVLIPKLMRERTKSEKCVAEVKDSGLLHVIKCREENDRMKKCMERWYYDQDFIKECTEQYLEERSEFRRTGIPKKQKNIRMEGSM
ncbi:hypothetical protein P5V15_007664 [Pogonomyrmex californicus]